MQNNVMRAIVYLTVAAIVVCTMLDVIAQPLLWPLAMATTLLIALELSAYHFPIIWYLYSHPYHAKKHKTRHH